MDSFYRLDRNMRYISGMAPILNKDALYSDTTGNYISPAEPQPFGKLRVRFRTAKDNVDRVYVHSGTRRVMMIKAYSDEHFDFYVAELKLGNEPISYYFEILSGKIRQLFDDRGAVETTETQYQFTVAPGLSVPGWAKGAVMYQIYVDRFCNGDPANDVLSDEYVYLGEHVKRVEDWNAYPQNMDVRNFYGGDLQGVLDKMDYLQELGVEVIYFNPLFLSPSNHKYDIQDYDHIDPHFGKIVKDEGELLAPDCMENRYASRYITRVADRENLEASDYMFAQVVAEAHKRGMRVIIDGVFNHCGSFNKWMDKERIYENFEGYEKGAYTSYDSPYHEYFAWFSPAPQDWKPVNGSYDCWWGNETLPKLNYENSRRLMDYILYIGRKWVSPPFNADGWRLDVAADLGHSQDFNHSFWKEFRRNVRQANPNAVVLAEHYGSARTWLFNGEWDTVMNYDAFMEPVSWFLTGMQKHSDSYREDMRGNALVFFDTMRYRMLSFPMPSLQSAMNELSNHDHSRFLTRTNRRVGRVADLGPQAANEGVDKAVFREAVVIQMTWMGAPTIYYGDEAGVCGFTDPDNRRTYPWGHEDTELIAFHKEIIRIHKEYACLKTGSFIPLCEEYNVLGYGRFFDNEQVVVVVNNNEEEKELVLPVWKTGAPANRPMRRVMLTHAEGYDVSVTDAPVERGRLHAILPPKSATVYAHREAWTSKTHQNELTHRLSKGV